MRTPALVLMLLTLAACGPKEPDWVDACACDDGEVCLDGGRQCVALPESCEPVFGGDECAPGALEKDCVVDACGYWSGQAAAACHTRGKNQYFQLDCAVGDDSGL